MSTKLNIGITEPFVRPTKLLSDAAKKMLKPLLCRVLLRAGAVSYILSAVCTAGFFAEYESVIRLSVR